MAKVWGAAGHGHKPSGKPYTAGSPATHSLGRATGARDQFLKFRQPSGGTFSRLFKFSTDHLVDKSRAFRPREKLPKQIGCLCSNPEPHRLFSGFRSAYSPSLFSWCHMIVLGVQFRNCLLTVGAVSVAIPDTTPVFS